MPADPGELYTVHAEHLDGLDAPVLVVAMDGYVDAGNGVRLAVEHLLALDADGQDDAAGPPSVVTFDADALVDYRSRRPALTFSDGAFVAYADPALRIRRLTDTAGTGYLLLSGPEPDIGWERFCAAVIDVVAELDVRLTISLLAFPMAVPHTRPPSMTQHATRPELVDASRQPWNGAIQIPGHVSGLLELRLGEAGKDAMGLAAHVPHYLARGDHPVTAQQLVARLGEVSGLQLDPAGLDETVGTFTGELAEEIAGNDEVAEVVRALEQQYDSFVAATGASLLATGQSLPTADELAAQVEAFLAEQDRP